MFVVLYRECKYYESDLKCSLDKVKQICNSLVWYYNLFTVYILLVEFGHSFKLNLIHKHIHAQYCITAGFETFDIALI